MNRTRQVAMVALLGGGVIAGTALALGAGPLVDEIRQTQIDERQEKIEVWRQSLAVLRSHPAGIGRGAFNEVFPVYRATGSFLTQDFVENEILQHLIDLGWIGFGVLVVAMIFAGRRLWPRARRDTVDLALMAGLAALFVHNIFDFGWEILGIRLPVVAVAGITVGRSLRSGHHEGPSRLFGVHATAVLVLGIVGLAAHWQPAGRDFDLAIRRAPAHEKAALAQIAAQHHPVDYFYPLAQALAEPVRPGPDGRSPRLVALNRAVRLCPSCYRVQVEIARALFALGRRSQSVLQWQIAFDLQPSMTLPGLNELMRAGAQPEELAACRPQAPEAAAVVARVLVGMGVERVALQAIDWAESRGVAMLEIALLRAELAVKVARFDVAEEQLQAAQAMDPREPRLFLGLADIAQARGDLDQALGLLHEGVTVNPGHAGLAIRRVDVIVTHGLWEHLDPALLALKQAHAGNPDAALQAHILAARAYEKRGNLPRALQEYRAGANLRPDHVGVWRHLAAAAQQGGHFTVALDAYREVLRLVPGDEKAQQALTVLEDKREEIRRGRFWVPRLPTGAAR